MKNESIARVWKRVTIAVGLKSGSQLGDILCPQETLSNVSKLLKSWAEESRQQTGLCWVEVRPAAKHPPLPRIDFPTLHTLGFLKKDTYLVQNVGSVTTKKLYARVIRKWLKNKLDSEMALNHEHMQKSGKHNRSENMKAEEACVWTKWWKYWERIQL